LEGRPLKNKGRNKGWNNLRPVKKGEVRNPHGRPPLELTFSDIAREILSSNSLDITYTFPGKKEPVTKHIELKTTRTFYHGLVSALLNEGLSGNVMAARELVNRVQGMPKQEVDIQSKGKQISNAPVIQVVDSETAKAVNKMFSESEQE
jgi:predicted secreted Zn-dependent protease